MFNIIIIFSFSDTSASFFRTVSVTFLICNLFSSSPFCSLFLQILRIFVSYVCDIRDKEYYSKYVDKFMLGSKQLLGLSIERKGSMIALGPKRYSIYSKNSEINKLKRVSLTDNEIHYDDDIDIIVKNITKSGVNNMINCKGCKLFI